MRSGRQIGVYEFGVCKPKIESVRPVVVVITRSLNSSSIFEKLAKSFFSESTSDSNPEFRDLLGRGALEDTGFVEYPILCFSFRYDMV